MENHHETSTKQKTVQFSDQPIIHYNESPPAYHEVCPQFAPQPLSPILDVDASNVIVPETNVHTSHTQQIILSPPVSSRLTEGQSQNGPNHSKFWKGGIILIILSCLAMIVAFPCGIIAMAWSLSAYYESNPSRRKRAVLVAILMNIFIIVTIIAVIFVFTWVFN